MTILLNCCYLFIAVSAATAAVVNILCIVMQVMAVRNGGRLRLYMTRWNITELKELFVNLGDPDRRRRYMLILHIFKICVYVFLTSAVLSFLLFFIHAFYQRSKLGVS